MKKVTVLLLLLLVIPAFLLAQTTPTTKSGEAEGTKLGNIINTVIGIVFPQVQPLINMLFPKPNTPPEKTAEISKKDLEDKLNKVKTDMQNQMKAVLDPVARIATEIEVLRNVLKPCIEIQDYLREINVLIAKSPITEENWKRVHVIWLLIKERVHFISTDKGCDVKPIRNRDVKTDLTLIINVGKGTKLERIEIDFLNLVLSEINSGDNATRFRIEISKLLELYQTVQLILDLSLQELQSDFSGAYEALGGGPVKIMSTSDLAEANKGQQKISERLNEVFKKLPDKKNK
jgi:hypothetical protein